MIRVSARELGERRELLARSARASGARSGPRVRWRRSRASGRAARRRDRARRWGPTGGRSAGRPRSASARAAHAVGVAGAREEVAELGGAQPERRPGVAELDGPPQRAGGAAADPDRDARLRTACGSTRRSRNAKYVAVVLGARLGERGAQRAERVVGTRTAVGERRAEQRELLLERSRCRHRGRAARRSRRRACRSASRSRGDGGSRARARTSRARCVVVRAARKPKTASGSQ